MSDNRVEGQPFDPEDRDKKFVGQPICWCGATRACAVHDPKAPVHHKFESRVQSPCPGYACFRDPNPEVIWHATPCPLAYEPTNVTQPEPVAAQPATINASPMPTEPGCYRLTEGGKWEDLRQPATTPTPQLSFSDLRKANISRCSRWHPRGLTEWSLSDWGVATAGEMGEALNIIKKLNRERDGITGNTATITELKQCLADEIADVAIYLDILAASEGIDLASAIAEKFNRTSVKVGFPERLAAKDSIPQGPPEQGFPSFLADKIWSEWHGPLGEIPTTHDETVESLGKMIREYDALTGPQGPQTPPDAWKIAYPWVEDGSQAAELAREIEDYACRRIAELSRQQVAAKWISVEEKLPDANWYGLISTTEGNIEVAYFRRDPDGPQSVDTFWQLERTNPQDETIRLDAEQVTHWQPLPAPPVEQVAAKPQKEK
jgi:NTP pyrophosphatase (non-canonical NTP hydrolase)